MNTQKVVEQPIASGLLAGKSINMRLIDKVGNDTCPLLSINDLRRLRMVIDYEEGTVMFKDNPDVWHELPTTKKGLIDDTLDQGIMRPTQHDATTATNTNSNPKQDKEEGNSFRSH